MSNTRRKSERINGKKMNFDIKQIGGNVEVFVEHNDLEDLENFYHHIKIESEDKMLLDDKTYRKDNFKSFHRHNVKCIIM